MAMWMSRDKPLSESESCHFWVALRIAWRFLRITKGHPRFLELVAIIGRRIFKLLFRLDLKFRDKQYADSGIVNK